MGADEFIATDAFGDFIFLGSISAPPVTAAKPPATVVEPTKPWSTFTFPVRSRSSRGGFAKLQNDANAPAPDVAADASATIVISKAGSLPEGFATPLDASNLAGDTSKSDYYLSGRVCARSASLDTANPLLNRDQSLRAPHMPTLDTGLLKASQKSTPHADVCPPQLDTGLQTPRSPTTLTNCHQANPASPPPLSSRSSSRAGSGGGAGLGGLHHPHPHHSVWHSTEWWRSFSSSRLNQLAAEEPDKRSPEMRRVPYTGGAEPMYMLLHGGSE